MSQQVIPFVYQDRPIRVIQDDSGQPWFAATDVCAVLTVGNSRMALDRLDDDEKGVSSMDTRGGKQELAVVNEPGLYRLILTSRKPEAQAFKRWVIHEVLPQIRKTGTYTASNMSPFPITETQAERMREAIPRLRALALAQKHYLRLYRGQRLTGQQLMRAVNEALFQEFGLDLTQVAPLPNTPNHGGSRAADKAPHPVNPDAVSDEVTQFVEGWFQELGKPDLPRCAGMPNWFPVSSLLDLADTLQLPAQIVEHSSSDLGNLRRLGMWLARLSTRRFSIDGNTYRIRRYPSMLNVLDAEGVSRRTRAYSLERGGTGFGRKSRA